MHHGLYVVIVYCLYQLEFYHHPKIYLTTFIMSSFAAVRAKRCVAHQKAEISARKPVRDDLYMHAWVEQPREEWNIDRHILIMLEQEVGVWDEKTALFVSIDLDPNSGDRPVIPDPRMGTVEGTDLNFMRFESAEAIRSAVFDARRNLDRHDHEEDGFF